MKQIFVTGISTDVGKTIASAIIVEALKADYWKPIQAGALENSDSHEIARLISNSKTVIHKNSYALKAAMSPHAAAEKEGIIIDREKIIEPETDNHLVIEGAGGLLVPLNEEDTILDIIMPRYKVVVVSRHYLGSINHTLLTVGWLNRKGYDVSILFSGNKMASTEEIIQKKTGATVLGNINEESFFNKEMVLKYAELFRPKLELL